MKLTPVVPFSATKTVKKDPEHLSFFDAFGMLGIPILSIAVSSMLWTIWLICLNIAPNATANYLMDTGDFDNGDFWLILRPESMLLGFTILSLSFIVVMYGTVLLRMTIWRNFELQRSSIRGRAISKIVSGVTLSSRNVERAKHVWQDVTGFNGRWRKHWNLILKAIDLTLQMLTLHRNLEYGFAPALCFGYAALVATNTLSCVAFILSKSNHSALVEVLADTIFDMLFAVGGPIILLTYAYYHFDLDRAQARLILEVTSPGDFERQARLMADPRQVSTFLLNFNALRTHKWGDLVVQTVMNMSFCYRLLRVVQVYIDSRRRNLNSIQLLSDGTSYHTRKKSMTLETIPLKSQARVPRAAALAFLGVGVIAIVYTHESIAHSTRACKAYPECGTFAYRWSTQPYCPCLAYIDVDKAPKTFEEWTNPKDVTESVAALAASGDLLVLNIINRRLRVWPDELSRCTNMQYISLMYTDLEEIPSWAARFTKLEYLSIEGKMHDTSLTKMPNDLFDNMAVLANLHLGVHFHLKRLPGLDGLRNLNGLSLAVLTQLNEIPDISNLKKLQRVEIVWMTSLRELPNLSDKVSLSLFAVVLSLPCCNGFLGKCDLLLTACIGMDPASCLTSDYQEHELTENTQMQIDGHNSTTCALDRAFRGVPMEQIYTGPTKEQVEKCQGVLYRECIFDTAGNWSVGHSVCLNYRFQVVLCVYSDYAILLRRRQISRNIGPPCDPDVEAWLGCQPKTQH